MKRIAIAAVLSSIFFAAVSPAQHTFNELSSTDVWIGVDLQRGKDDAGNRLEYPVIVSVQLNSPADNAGLIPGDTVLKFGNIDAHKDPFGLRRLLQPDRHILLKLRHNGVRTVTVVARRRPEQFKIFLNDGMDGMITMTSDSIPLRQAMQMTLAPIAAPSSMRVTRSVVGASVAQMNAGLAEVLHMQNQGVIVLEVNPATPAMRAGLKGGDVIVKAGATQVTTLAILFQAISAKTKYDSVDRRIALDVVRMGKERRVTLRW